ncbi:MAG: hypothetical protein RIC51_11555 [Erythrobacter sp.]|uniref:hypothetical protein n=1 Tax=Erythrobacter sp. TaxID=1042 RepID=UPI0032EBC726
MPRNGFVNIRTALAFAAVVSVGAGFVAANFDGVSENSDDTADYAEAEYGAADYGTDTVEQEPEPATQDSANGAYSETPDGWYDTPYDDVEPGEPLDDAKGFDPSPVLPTEPVDEDYVIVEGDGSLNGEYPEGY